MQISVLCLILVVLPSYLNYILWIYKDNVLKRHPCIINRLIFFLVAFAFLTPLYEFEI